MFAIPNQGSSQAFDVLSTSDTHTNVSSKYLALGWYKIDRIHESEPACIIFARHIKTNESIVLKLLIEFKDIRYSLTTVGERQQCQVEALRWNRLFTPSVYIGLVHISEVDLNQKKLEIDEVIKDPAIESLSPDKEYALLMRPLPHSRRLDYLLIEPEESLELLLHILIRYIGRIHIDLSPLSLLPEEAKRWGSCEWLQNKLDHNLVFLDQILAADRYGQYDNYYWLKDSLSQIFKQLEYKQCFNQRVEEQRIKRCHADIKAQNIWLAPFLPDAFHHYRFKKKPEKYIFLLDAIDFNPMYSNIDILSDLAMLLTDIEARTNQLPLVNDLIESYLSFTNQQDRISRLVLAYYLVEKSIVGSAVSILYDNQPIIGQAFLEVANTRMIDLENQMGLYNHLPFQSPVFS
ncbi:MAG TPA: hypothetical protein VKR83_10575 [Ktedonobacteraceae bacterium]|nr:hypothetical protein [Ktedonobacteraceae bacterium]